MSSNKIITSLNALTNDNILPITNNVIVIDSSNNRIGINISDPLYSLDICKNSITGSGSLRCNNLYDISFIKSSSNNNIDISGFVIIDGSLNIYDTLGAPQIVLTSDDRLKHNEKIIDNGLTIVRQLKPYIYDKTYTFKDSNYKGKLDVPYFKEAGFIAQELEKINDISFSITIGSIDKPYNINYNNLITYSIAAIKDLDIEVTNNKFLLNDISLNLNIKKNNIIELTESNDLSYIHLINLSDKLDNKIKILEENIESIKNNINMQTINFNNNSISNLSDLLNKQNYNIKLLNNKISILEQKLNN